jgi:hypothetical protein
MSPSHPEPVLPAVRAQILATEHWGLLAVRSQTWAEVMGRITAQLMFTSASLLFLALVGQSTGYNQTFRLLAVILGLTLLATGTLTAFRVANASQEDYFFVMGMNRLRAAYVDIDPTLAPYFITGLTDDQRAVQHTYTMGPSRDINHVLASASMFVTVVNTIVVGGVAAFVAWPAGAWVSAPVALAVMVGHFALWALHGRNNFRTSTDPQWVRFPASEEGEGLS